MSAETFWPHAPPHDFSERGIYFVTGSTYGKLHHFRTPRRLDVLERGLLRMCADAGWTLEAWAVFSNHYHFVGRSPESDEDARSLKPALTELHRRTAIWVNRLDRTPARKVWFNFRDTHLPYQRSYLARLAYTHHNAVKHRLVAVATQYPWCSARWIEGRAGDAHLRTLSRIKTDTVNVPDDFEPTVDSAAWEI
jgi:putative transposase